MSMSRGARASRRAGDDENHRRQAQRAAAVCAAVPQSRQARHRADREYPVLSRPAPELVAAATRRDGFGRISSSSPSPISSSRSTTPTIRSRAGSIIEEQKPAAKRRTQDFWRYRVPKFLGYFERVLQKNGGQYLIGRRLTYVDLSICSRSSRACATAFPSA